MDSSHFLAVSSPWPLYKTFFDFWFRPRNAQNLLPKMCKKSLISRLVWQTERWCLGLPGGFRYSRFNGTMQNVVGRPMLPRQAAPDETNGVNNTVSCFEEAVQFSASFVTWFTSLFASFWRNLCFWAKMWRNHDDVFVFVRFDTTPECLIHCSRRNYQIISRSGTERLLRQLRRLTCRLLNH